MAGRSHLCAGPEEILSYIVEHLRPISYKYWDRRNGHTIRLFNDQVLDLSQVNHLFRRLCLPLLYEHIIIELTGARPFHLFKRTVERKPHLARLVKVIEVMRYFPGPYWDTSHEDLDFLPFLPKIKRIDFPCHVKLDLKFLSVINSHPSQLTFHWQGTRTDDFSFPKPLSLPHGALSRVRIDGEYLSGDSESIELRWLYFAKLGLRVKSLTITETTPPRFFSLTYPDLYSIHIHVPPFFSSDSPEPLEWFPSFLERHSQLKSFLIHLDQNEGRPAWEALKNIPIIKPLYDASYSRGLISSFYIASIDIRERFGSSWASINVDSPQDLPEIIHLLGSLLSIPIIDLNFHKPEPHFLPMNVNDFVSTFQENYKTLSSLTLYAVRQVLDLDSLSTEEELHINHTSIVKEVLSAFHDRTKQLAQLTRLLCSGLPRLQYVYFHERGSRGIEDFYLMFSVLDDGQVELSKITRLC